MPKPGQMKNIANPMSTDALTAVRAVGATSNQTPETCQCAPRKSKPSEPMGANGQAEVEENDVMEGQGYSDTTASTRVVYRDRKRLLGS